MPGVPHRAKGVHRGAEVVQQEFLAGQCIGEERARREEGREFPVLAESYNRHDERP